MKINEKNVAAFALSATPVDREGFLYKKNELNKSSQKRWFLLKGNLLFYFEKRGDKEPVGLIVLEGCTIELAEDEDHFGFKIVFHGPGNRSYSFGAESQESMEQWMKALACASYDYMKLMVAELQRQLDEMEESECLIMLSDSINIAPTDNPSNGSPLPPPRQRHNPFNRIPPDSSSSYRSHSTRSAPGRSHSNTRPIENVPRTKVSFRELHTSYGRRVLTDFNIWRHEKRVELEQKQSATMTQDLLITL